MNRGKQVIIETGVLLLLLLTYPPKAISEIDWDKIKELFQSQKIQLDSGQNSGTENPTPVVSASSLTGNRPPTVTVSASPQKGKAPLKVYFTGSGSDTDGWVRGYKWDFGDGETSALRMTAHTYSASGVYTARLTATDNDKAEAVGTISVTVETADSPESGPAPTPQPAPKPSTSVLPLIRFQAKLTDAQDTTLADGTYKFTFRLYETESAGQAIWQENQQITTAQGSIQADLGAVTSLKNLSFNKQYWLGIEVENDGEMSPRFRLGAAPYALNR